MGDRPRLDPSVDGMSEQPSDRSRLTRIAVIVAVLTGVATIVGVLWTIFPQNRVRSLAAPAVADLVEISCLSSSV
jgi:hypothetical protein